MRLNLTKYNNLKQRVIVAVLGAIVLLGSIIFNEWSYFSIFFIIYLLTIYEFFKLCGLDGMLPLKSWGAFAGAAIYVTLFLVYSGISEPKILYWNLPICFTIFFIKLYKKGERKPFTNIAYTFLGIIYVALPFSLLHGIAYINGTYDYRLIIAILFLIWATDIGAYFVGVRFGKKKLFERVSPNKSWEGLIGGVVFNMAMVFAIHHGFDLLPLWKLVVIGILVIVAGTYGDLVESLFKRSIAIKDSGTILPGHGGFLDRFDALLLSVPFICAFLQLF